MNNYLLTAILLCLCIQSFAQKSLEIIRTKDPITIDGKFDEKIWENAPVADDFSQYRPSPGPRLHDTKVKLVYDDEALYVAAYMADVSRDSIMTELTERDNIGNTDFFGFYIDTYGNGTEGTEFIIAATGVQFDAKIDQYNEDTNWDGIWECEVRLTDHGWYAEFKIPYAAIRFPKKDIQNWNVNFFRRRQVTGTQDGWVFVDFERDNPFLTQIGKITGIKNIKPPVRLFLSPYTSVYAQHSRDKNRDPINSTGYSYNGGLDLKYGINDAFTLDMTLIPDFGQVQSDDQVLNLSPFEVRFDEQRQFFTEGTELFNKAGLFYSRRIGGSPIGRWDAYNDLSNTEEISENPQSAQLYNAAKISGRNSKGIGVGVFNAVSAASHAIATDLETGVERKVETAPLTNYSVFVVDKNLKNNSSASFTNTNVWRNGNQFHSANVSAVTFNLKSKGQVWGVEGNANLSQLLNPNEDNVVGHNYFIQIARLSGKFNYGINYEETSDTYDHNDLGFLRFNNNKEWAGYLIYNDVDGFGRFLRFRSWFNAYYERLYEPNEHIGMRLNGGFYMQGKNQWHYNMWTNYRPQRNDFFEPRQDGRKYIRPASFNIGMFTATDFRKPFSIEFIAELSKMDQDGRYETFIALGPRYRFSDKFNLGGSVRVYEEHNNEGWTDNYNDEIIFGRRDVRTIENIFSLKYTFNNAMNLDFRLRHNWATVINHSFHNLSQDGYLSPTDYTEFKDRSFSSFNIDMVYRWRFKPGSDIFVVWKNNIQGEDSDPNINYQNLSYGDELNRLGNFVQNNSLSIRVVYFLDYAQLNRVF